MQYKKILDKILQMEVGLQSLLSESRKARVELERFHASAPLKGGKNIDRELLQKVLNKREETLLKRKSKGKA